MNRQALQRGAEGLPLLPRHLAALLAPVHPADGREQLRQPARQKRGQHIRQLLAGLGFQFPLNPRVQLLRRQPRLQIQRYRRLHQIVRQMAAHGQRQRAGNAEVRKQHFPQLAVERLLAPLQRQGHIAQGQALQLLGPVVLRFDGGQHGRRRRHRMPCRLSEGVPVAGGAGHGIAAAAGGQHHRVGGEHLATHQRYAADAPLRLIQGLHPGVQPHLYPALL